MRGSELIEQHMAGERVFEQANLRLANLRDAAIGGSNLRAVNLRGASLVETRIDDTTRIDDGPRLVWEIVNQGAQGRDLSSANLSGATLHQANLSRSNLRDADLRETNLSAADLRGTNLRGATLPDGKKKRPFTRVEKYTEDNRP